MRKMHKSKGKEENRFHKTENLFFFIISVDKRKKQF